MFYTIIAFLGGVLAASGSIIKKKPNAAELIDKIAPYQGFIGVIVLISGIFGLLGSLTSIGSLSFGWIIGLITSLATFTVGFLLSFSLLSKYLFSKNETALEKGQSLRGKLVNYQIPAGYLLIVMAILSLLTYLRIL